jgi:preprotein translocase subunit SecA
MIPGSSGFRTPQKLAGLLSRSWPRPRLSIVEDPAFVLSFLPHSANTLFTLPFLPPQVKDLYDPREQWASYILNAIKAKELFLRDVNYIVKNGEIFIVDEFTGRVMEVSLFS